MYLCSNTGVKSVLKDWLLENAPHLTLDMCIEAANAVLHSNS